MEDLLSQDEINALISGNSLDLGDSVELSMEETHILHELASIFVSSENSVFGILSGKSVDSQADEARILTQGEFLGSQSENPFVFRATFGGFDDIPLVLTLEQRGALTLADLMMGGEGKELPSELSDLYLNASQEGISQVVGSVFTSLSGLLGGRRLMPENVSSSLAEEGWLPFSNLDLDSKVWLSTSTVNIEGLDPFKMQVLLPMESAKAIAVLANEVMGGASAAPSKASLSEQGGSHSAPNVSAAMSHSDTSAPPKGAQRSAPVVDVRPAEFVPLVQKSQDTGSSRIDMIADIPVRVTVELGKTRKNVSEILGMTTGSLIELDKMAGEPVDILVNGKPIAKGEVVVIDENFGVRVTEVLGATAKAYSY